MKLQDQVQELTARLVKLQKRLEKIRDRVRTGDRRFIRRDVASLKLTLGDLFGLDAELQSHLTVDNFESFEPAMDVLTGARLLLAESLIHLGEAYQVDPRGLIANDSVVWMQFHVRLQAGKELDPKDKWEVESPHEFAKYVGMDDQEFRRWRKANPKCWEQIRGSRKIRCSKAALDKIRSRP